MCSPASFETAYVQRASPTEPIVDDVALARRGTHACRRPRWSRSRRSARACPRGERRLERVVGADHVHAHRPHRALDHGVDAGDRGAVDDVRRAARELGSALGVEHVPLVEARSSGARRAACRRARRGAGCRPRRPGSLDEPAGERRADEARPARDEDALFLVSHTRGSLATPSRARSSSSPSPPSRSRGAAAPPAEPQQPSASLDAHAPRCDRRRSRSCGRVTGAGPHAPASRSHARSGCRSVPPGGSQVSVRTTGFAPIAPRAVIVSEVEGCCGSAAVLPHPCSGKAATATRTSERMSPNRR